MSSFDKKNFIAISAIWYERFLECSRTYHTSEFPDSVWRFYLSLLDIGEGKYAIRSIVDDYIRNIWKPNFDKLYVETCKAQNLRYEDEAQKKSIYRDCEYDIISEMFDFIKQTIQDSGIGWHTSDEMQSFQIKQE